MFNVNNLIRENLKNLHSYHVWRDDYLENNDAVFLDNCENNFGSPLGLGNERYPSSSQTQVKQAIADYKKVMLNQVTIGNGSDELIDLLIRSFCEPKKDNIIICEPTFGMFKIYAQLNDIEVLNAPLIKDTFLFDENLIYKTTNLHTKLIFIVTPNNPTGTSISLLQIEILAKQFSGLLIIDEAYIDFSEKESAMTLINTYSNIVVLQTFSKAWGLAALRVGVAYGNEEVISILNKVRPPFNISTHSQELILKALQHSDKKDELVKLVLQQKILLYKELSSLHFIKRIVASDANYFLIEVDDADQICSYLLEHNILISNRTTLLNCKNHIRISAGNENENNKLITLLKKYHGS